MTNLRTVIRIWEAYWHNKTIAQTVFEYKLSKDIVCAYWPDQRVVEGLEKRIQPRRLNANEVMQKAQETRGHAQYTQKSTMKDAIYSVLEKSEKPMTAREITDVLLAQGRPINSERPENVVGACLWRYPNKFEKRDVGYTARKRSA